MRPLFMPHRRDKTTFYLAKGTQLVWLIYPEEWIVEVLTATDRQLLIEGDTLTGGDVLPGLRIAITALFA